MKEQREVDEMLEMISEAPDSQIDKTITDKMKKLIGKPISEIKISIMYCIDMCVYGSLSSDFALQALLILHEIHCDGNREDFNDENCPWRKEMKCALCHAFKV